MFRELIKVGADGFTKSKELYAKYTQQEPVELIDKIVSSAINNWAKVGHNDYAFNMVAFEIEKNSESFLNIQYDIKSGKFSKKQLDDCKDNYLDPNEGDWAMVEYCLNNR